MRNSGLRAGGESFSRLILKVMSAVSLVLQTSGETLVVLRYCDINISLHHIYLDWNSRIYRLLSCQVKQFFALPIKMNKADPTNDFNL